MNVISDRTQANMDIVLEDACRHLSAIGGNHESRKFIAERLVLAAREGKATLHELTAVARQALQDLNAQRRDTG